MYRLRPSAHDDRRMQGTKGQRAVQGYRYPVQADRRCASADLFLDRLLAQMMLRCVRRNCKDSTPRWEVWRWVLIQTNVYEASAPYRLFLNAFTV